MSEKTKLSENFTLEELSRTTLTEYQEENREAACNYVPVLTRVCLELLEPIRKEFGPLKINSGFRGLELNAAIGGSLTSQHCKGEAADFDVLGHEDRATQVKVAKWAKTNLAAFGQLLLERGCIHISLGTKKEILEYDVSSKTKKPIPELKSA